MPSITIEIGKKGEIKQEAFGYTGKKCLGPMDRFAKALGADPESLQRNFKPESLEDSSEQVQGG